MGATNQWIEVPVNAGSLSALRFGTGPRTAVAAHGITASGMAFRAVARRLPSDWTLIALDLRGRGASAALPGPFGIDAHASDICGSVEQLGIGPVTLVGHSMGAYAALRAAANRPDLIERLVLVDGGIPLPVPDGADLDQVLEDTVGPAIARLSQTFPSEQAHLDLFRDHPALAGSWNADLEAYVRYDLTGSPGAFRSVVNETAVRRDGRDLLDSARSIGADLAGLAVPTLLLVAPSGMLGEPPGLLPKPLVEHWDRQTAALRVEVVGDTNHYTILMGELGADTVAARIDDAFTWPPAT
ncbi:MAG: alpha/beta hydrolase [Nocardioidaceae bacterium]|nr:alpha/beta hydrolase [Nocardioidaceae bacterium]